MSQKMTPLLMVVITADFIFLTLNTGSILKTRWMAYLQNTSRIHLSPHLSCLIDVILCLDHYSLLASLFCSCTSVVYSALITRVILFICSFMLFCPLAPLLSYQSTVKLRVFLAPKQPRWFRLWLLCWTHLLPLFCSLCSTHTGLLGVPGTCHAHSCLESLTPLCLQHSSPSSAGISLNITSLGSFVGIV